MFDWTQRGAGPAHRYRGYYDAGERSTSHCAQCNRVIRFCYSLHDQNQKSFIIGTCCFSHYEGTKTLIQLEAAKLLQEATKAAIEHDTKLYGTRSDVRQYRKQWLQARREALRLLRLYRKGYGEWLPKKLFDLQATTLRSPRNDYKRQTYALHWYENTTKKLAEQRDAVLSSPDLRSI